MHTGAHLRHHEGGIRSRAPEAEEVDGATKVAAPTRKRSRRIKVAHNLNTAGWLEILEGHPSDPIGLQEVSPPSSLTRNGS